MPIADAQMWQLGFVAAALDVECEKQAGEGSHVAEEQIGVDEHEVAPISSRVIRPWAQRACDKDW